MSRMFQMAPESMKYTYSRSGEMKWDDRSIKKEMKGNQWSHESGVFITYYVIQLICGSVKGLRMSVHAHKKLSM